MRDTIATHKGSVDLHKLRVEFSTAVRNDDSASQGEITVKPGMPQAASICLHSNLEIARVYLFGHRSDLQELGQMALASFILSNAPEG